MYANKLDNLEEMTKFLERHKILKYTPKYDNISSSMYNKEIGFVI